MDNKYHSMDTAGPSKYNDSSRQASAHKTTSFQIKSEKLDPIFRIVKGCDWKNTDKNSKANIPKHNVISEEDSRKRGDLFTEATGPFWHKISNSMITPPVIASNLWLQFRGLPITGAPLCAAMLADYEDKKIREYVGDMDDEDYEELKNYCSPDNLKTGKELKMSTSYPIIGMLSRNIADNDTSDEEMNKPQTRDKAPEADLNILRSFRKRQKLDSQNTFMRLMKYRGVKHFPLKEQKDNIPGMNLEPPDLKPGRDVLFRVRLIRPFNVYKLGDKNIRTRHSVFSCDLVVSGRQPLTALRDRISCWNDLDMRLDKSNNPDEQPIASAKAVFPSGFLFINNVFYVDRRAGCRDTSAPVRRWAQQRRVGAFPVRSMEAYCLDDVVVRLAHPEVYVHQGNCEHVFVFSEIRLLNRSDPLLLSAYPCHTLTSQNQSTYCTSCTDYLAKWLVTDTNRVPFEPAFFCDTCFKQYMYIDGRKIGQFKAYAHRGNELVNKNPLC